MMMELDESFQVEFWTSFILVLPRLSLCFCFSVAALFDR
jgi:hypothetical protein